MKQVTIVFSSWNDLWDFQKHVRTSNLDIIQNACELTGLLSEREIAFAVDIMKAKLVD